MIEILGGIFLGLNLLVRVPIRIGLKINPRNEKLAKLDAIAFIATGVVLIAMIICGLLEGEIESGLATAALIVFGGAFLMIIVPLSLAAIKDRRYWIDIYNKTNQRYNNDDYGFSKENPIWAGSYDDYMKHISAENGEHFKWKYSKEIELPKDNGIVKINGIWGCKLHKIKVIYEDERIDTIYIMTKAGLEKMKTWHAPKGYVYKS